MHHHYHHHQIEFILNFIAKFEGNFNLCQSFSEIKDKGKISNFKLNFFAINS